MSDTTSSHDPQIYGWCPGALRPMMSGDGLVVRIRAPLGRLTSDQAQAVAALSRRFGNGLIDLSARANLQLRGIHHETHADLIAALQDLELVDRDIASEARRNVIVTPFWQEGDTSQHIARELSTSLRKATDLALPGKFGFAIDCGDIPALQETAADIRIEATPRGLILRADGAEVGLPVTPQTAAVEAINLARWFLVTNGAPGGRGRMKAHVASGVALPSGHDSPRNSSSFFRAKPGPTPSGFLAALEFGQISADCLADLTLQGSVRFTPWRMFLVEGAGDIAPQPGLILDASDPRLRVTACTGAPDCLQALSSTRDLARDLAPHIPKDSLLHVSGCAKGCAHPAPATLVLTATAPDTFNLIHHGKAGDQPLKETLSAGALRAAPAILTEGS